MATNTLPSIALRCPVITMLLLLPGQVFRAAGKELNRAGARQSRCCGTIQSFPCSANILTLLLVIASLQSVVRAGDLYFPPHQGAWETVEPEQVGWDAAMLQEALDYAGENQSSGVVILHKGKVLAKQPYEVQGPKSAKYTERVLGRDEEGRAIEDVASAQKSIASTLVGIAQQKGLLNINDPVSQHLSVGGHASRRRA